MLAVLAPAVPTQATALPAVQITRGWYESPGSDLRSNAGLNGEYVILRNTTRRAIDLAGWTLRDKTGYTYNLRRVRGPTTNGVGHTRLWPEVAAGETAVASTP